MLKYASPVATRVRDAVSSPGHPVDPGARAFLEPRLGQDFGKVRVHVDATAARSAAALNARAFTVGRDIVFGANQYAPGSPQGRAALAHELTHVVQQAAGTVEGAVSPGPGGVRLSRPDDPFEHAARAAASRVLGPPPLEPAATRLRVPPRDPLNAPVQRLVLKAEEPSPKPYYSDQDPQARFATAEEAEAHERQIAERRVATHGGGSAASEGPEVKRFEELFRSEPRDQWRDLYKRLALQYHPDKGGVVVKFQALQEAYGLLTTGAPGGGPTLTITHAPEIVERERGLQRTDPRLAALLGTPGVRLDVARQLLQAMPTLSASLVPAAGVLLGMGVDPSAAAVFLRRNRGFSASAEGAQVMSDLLAPPQFTLVHLAGIVGLFPGLARVHVPLVRALRARNVAPDDIGAFCVGHGAFAASAHGHQIAGQLLAQRGFGLGDLGDLLHAFPGLALGNVAVVKVLIGAKKAIPVIAAFCSTHGAFVARAGAAQVVTSLLSPGFSLEDLSSLVTGFRLLATAHVPSVKVLLVHVKARPVPVAAFCTTHTAFVAHGGAPTILRVLVASAPGFTLDEFSTLLTAFPALTLVHAGVLKVFRGKGATAAAITTFCPAHAVFMNNAQARGIANQLLGPAFTLPHLGQLLTGFVGLALAHVPGVKELLARTAPLTEVIAFCNAHAAFLASAAGPGIVREVVAPPAFTHTDLSTLLSAFPALGPVHVPTLKTLISKASTPAEITAFCPVHAAFLASPGAPRVAGTLLAPPDFMLPSLGTLLTAFPGLSPANVATVKVLHAKVTTPAAIATLCTAHPVFVAHADAPGIVNQLVEAPAFTSVQLGALLVTCPGLVRTYVPTVKKLIEKAVAAGSIGTFGAAYPIFVASARGPLVTHALVGFSGFTLANVTTVLASFAGLDETHVATVKKLIEKAVAAGSIGTFGAAHHGFLANADGPEIVDSLWQLFGFTVTRLTNLLVAFPGVRLDQLDVVKAFLRKGAHEADIATFAGNYPARMTDPGIPGIIRELLDRAGTAIALNGLFGLLTGLTAAELVTMFTDYFKGAPVPTIVIRVTALRVGRTPQQMLALLEKPSAALDTQFTTFPARQFPAWTVTYIRAALNIRGWAPAAVVSFLQDNSVKAELKKATREKNPAYWIWLFALHHGGAAPLGGGAPTVVNVAHVTGARVVRLEPWILQHVQNRHTFHHFDFWDPAALAPNRPTSGMLAPGFDILGEITRLLGNASVTSAVWDGSKIQIGTWEIRIAPDPGHLGEFRITSFFPETVAPMPIPRAIMLAIHQHLFP
ncbi:MAG TPA: DUF4157 domain-containing protein [Actinomycetota bacterium]|nr:DUF4157 domain-containing protein [Actinomycetota bacterium]